MDFKCKNHDPLGQAQFMQLIRGNRKKTKSIVVFYGPPVFAIPTHEKNMK